MGKRNRVSSLTLMASFAEETCTVTQDVIMPVSCDTYTSASPPSLPPPRSQSLAWGCHSLLAELLRKLVGSKPTASTVPLVN